MDKASVRLFLLCGLVTFLCLRGAVRAWITAVHTKALGFDWSLSHIGENRKMEAADAADLGRARRFLLGIPEEGTLALLDARFDAEEKGKKTVLGAHGKIAALVEQKAAVNRRLLNAIPHFDMDRATDEGGSRGPRLLTAAA